jgi:predicted NUDIX family phosphoesterase/dephospho-CoA kinase
MPLNIDDIVDRAIYEGILKSKGVTPQNTMRARLSEHIRELGEDSKFIRVASNKFALREWNIEEYTAPPFIKKHKDETVVCLKQEAIDTAGRFFGFSTNYKKYLSLFSNPSNIVVCKRNNANSNYSIKQIVAYVIIKNKAGKVLSYVRGSYTTTKDRLLKGVLCIGFGGHVNNDDYYNIFGLQDGGISNAAIREVNEELRNINIETPKLVGVINDDSTPLGLNHFAFVFVTKTKENSINEFSSEISINQTKFLTKKELNIRFSELEFWSQLLLKEIIIKGKEVDNIVIKEKRKKIDFPIIIVGEIGSGKSEIAKLLSRKLKCEFISTRHIVTELMTYNDFGTSNRSEFQSQSHNLIQNENGCFKIAQKIIELYNKTPQIVIDGIRNIDSYELIKKAIPSATLIYIDVPIDSSYDFFYKRSKRNATIHEFRMARYHDVEKEVVLFKNRADIYIYNGSSFKSLFKKITSWLDEKK